MPYQLTYDLLPKTVFGRVLAGLAGIAVVILAVFFLAVALAVAGVVLAVTVVRVLWLAHKTRQARPRADEPIVVEYSVVEERDPPDRRRDRP